VELHIVAMFGYNCTPCGSSDPTSDTVKVDMNGLAAPDKENESRFGNIIDEIETNMHNLEKDRAAQEKVKKAEEQRQIEAEKKEAQRAAAERERLEGERHLEEKRLLQQRLEAELLQAEAAAQELQRLQEAEADEAARARAEEEDRKRHEAVERSLAEEAERLGKEQLQVEQERLEKEKADRSTLDAFLKEHGFTSVNHKRSKMFKSKYPLHTAVMINNVDLVRILLAAGADVTLKSSAGQTPAQLAQKTDKKGSHARVLSQLSSTQ
jgi:hypothetical protein